MSRSTVVFSDKLAIFTEKHRPGYTPLSTKQAIQLASLGSYCVVHQDSHQANDKILILHPDGKYGLDGDFYVTWTETAVDSSLIFCPHFTSVYVRGDLEMAHEMEDLLSPFLPSLGFMDQVVVTLPEPVVHLHRQIRGSMKDWVTVMFKSEFKLEFSDLYQYLKTIFES